MDGKWLKWALIASWILLIFAILSIIIYISVPSILSLVLGTPISGDCGSALSASTGAQSDLTFALMSLCSSAKSFVGMSAMLLIVIAGIPALISYILATLEVVRSPMTGLRKAIWLILFWLFLGIIAVTAYYMTDRKKASTR